MKKRLLAMLLACAMLLTFLPAAVLADDPADASAETAGQGSGGVSAACTASGLPFTDVTNTASWYYTPVLWAVDNGVTKGKTDTSFAPGETCTRGQIVTFLWRAAGSPAVSGSTPFTDVKSDAYYASAVTWAVQNHITNGTTATTFSPSAVCTRAQVAAFLYRAAGSPAVSGSSSFTDVDPGSYYASAVAWAVENGVTTGMTGTTYAPYSGCTRAQVVTFLYRIHGMEASVGSYLIFGSYAQDLDSGNTEPVEWRVLKADGSKALVISKYILDAQYYHERYESTTWESSSLRSWLNNEFYNTAFTADQQAKILTTTVSAEDNTNYGVDAGNDTQDHIFLLSISEAYALFNGATQTKTNANGDAYTAYPDLQAAQTDYAYAESGNWDESMMTSDGALFWWWLRTPGETGTDAALVDCDGLVCTDGYPGCSPSGGIRPAMWISLE